MKQLTLKLVFPLTVISMAVFTKWWHTLPVDAPDTLLTGFPLPFMGPGWHTSMSLQIFVAEFFLDFLVYFLFWVIIIYCVNRFWIAIRVHRILAILLLSLTGLILAGAAFVASISDNAYYLKRPWNMEIKKTGYTFIWQDQPSIY